MQGIIERGNYTDKAISLTGDTEIAGGNWRVPKITTNGHVLIISHPVWNATIDGSKNPSEWPANVVINFPLTAEMLDPAGTHREYGPLQAALDIRFAFGRNKDAWAAWGHVIDIIHSGPANMTWQGFVSEYSAAVGDNLTYSTALFNRIKTVLPVGWGWTEVRDWVLSKTKAQLTGAYTEIVEEIS